MKTDAQLKRDIIAELKWETSVNAPQIGVEVKNGTVTLAGHVDSYTEKWQAERAVQRVSGVKGLAVEIDVKLPGLSKRTDGDIARSAQNILEWTSRLPKSGPRTAGLPCPVRLNGTTSDSSRRTQFARSSVLSVSAMTTFGRRLRAVGVSLEDRQDLLGHKSGRMTTHYSAAEVGNLWAAVNRIATLRESPEGTVLRIVG
jgi:BON domain